MLLFADDATDLVLIVCVCALLLLLASLARTL